MDGYAITDRYCVIHSKNIESEENIKTKVNWAVLNIQTEKYTEKDKICHIPGTMDLKVEAIEDDILGVKVFIDKNGMKLNDIFLETVNKKINLFFTEEEEETNIVFNENVSCYIIKKMLVLFKKKHFDIFYKNNMLLFKSNDLEMYFSYMLKVEPTEKEEIEIEDKVKEEEKKPINISELIEKIAKDRTVKI